MVVLCSFGLPCQRFSSSTVGWEERCWYQGVWQHAALVGAVGQLVATVDRGGVAVRAPHRLALLRKVGLRLQVIILKFMPLDFCVCEFILTAWTAQHPTWHEVTPVSGRVGGTCEHPLASHILRLFTERKQYRTRRKLKQGV